MTTLEAYYRIRAPLITLSKLVGVEIWTSDKYFTLGSYNVLILLTIYNICNIYTLVKRASNPIKLMQITILFAIATQLSFKFFYVLADKVSIRSMCDVLEEKIYRHYANATKEENVLIKKTVRYLTIIWKSLAALYSSTLLVFGLWPVYAYYSEGHLVPLFMYEIPMLDTDNRVGYLITLLFQVYIYAIGVFGLVMADYIFIFVIFHAITCIDLFILHITEFSSLLSTQTHEKDLTQIAAKWNGCMKDHQLATWFLNAIENVFGIICLAQVLSCIYTICDGMLLVALTDWYAAYCFLIVIFGGLSVYFITGHIVELKVDAMYEAIECCPWNLLNVSQQKEYNYLLARTQRPLTLTIYGFAPLNLDTYTTVLKSLYQYFVMVIQYIE